MDHRGALFVVVADLEVGPFCPNPFVEIVDLDRCLDRVESHPAVDLSPHPPGQVGLAGLEHVGIGPIRLDLVAAVSDQRMRPAASRLGLRERDGTGH